MCIATALDGSCEWLSQSLQFSVFTPVILVTRIVHPRTHELRCRSRGCLAARESRLAEACRAAEPLRPYPGGGSTLLLRSAAGCAEPRRRTGAGEEAAWWWRLGGAEILHHPVEHGLEFPQGIHGLLHQVKRGLSVMVSGMQQNQFPRTFGFDLHGFTKLWEQEICWRCHATQSSYKNITVSCRFFTIVMIVLES